jgi:PhzF family phenazine biosynthesis protein
MGRTLGHDEVMVLPLFQIDAFADHVFAGNPAAVMPLAEWLSDDVLQQLAIENNLSETAFFVPRGGDGPEGAGADDPLFDLRWFTPGQEVALCGHATLASAWLVLHQLLPSATTVHFHTLSGWLSVTKDEGAQSNGRLTMDFPAMEFSRTEIPEGAAEAVGAPIVAAWKGLDNIMFVVDDASTVRNFAVDSATIRMWTGHLLIVTAPADGDDSADGVDFVSRVFAPGVGIDEDPVTGSAHTMLTPYWSQRLNRTKLVGRQISARGGTLWLEDRKTRVGISGHAVLYLTGTVTI